MHSDFRLNRSVVVHLTALAALALCAPGCFLFGGGRARPSLVSNDPGSKIPAIKKASDARVEKRLS